MLPPHFPTILRPNQSLVHSFVHSSLFICTMEYPSSFISNIISTIIFLICFFTSGFPKRFAITCSISSFDMYFSKSTQSNAILNSLLFTTLLITNYLPITFIQCVKYQDMLYIITKCCCYRSEMLRNNNCGKSRVSSIECKIHKERSPIFYTLTRSTII